MRFSCIEYLSPHGGVEVGNRARAIDALVAALDDEVRIRAHHEQAATADRRHQVAIIVGRFLSVVEQTGAHHIVGGFNGREADVKPVKDRDVALWPDVEYGAALAASDHFAGEVA